MKVLVIYSHSYQETSHAGKVILEVFKAQPDFEVRNIEELYPQCSPIDIALEQERLVAADLIIFHHPIFWFSMPAGLKHYMDEVFQYGFAYGSTGGKLRGKKFIHSYTTGSGAATFAGELGDILPAALKGSAAFCGMEYLKAFPLYGQLALTNPNVPAEAKAHAERIVEYVHSL